MKRQRPVDVAEDNAAFDRIDALLANAKNLGAEVGAVGIGADRVALSRTLPPIERILSVVEQLLLIRVALERDATVTQWIRESLDHALREVTALCEDAGFATAPVRVDFMREDLRNGTGDLKNDITELVRHLRYDARSWKHARGVVA
jgi:hypothetical protein